MDGLPPGRSLPSRAAATAGSVTSVIVGVSLTAISSRASTGAIDDPSDAAGLAVDLGCAEIPSPPDVDAIVPWPERLREALR